MKLLLPALFIVLNTFCQAQTATNFSATDCNGVQHTLFAELDAGNVVVICWVMPCGACIHGAQYSSLVTANYPSNVLFYLCDDLGDNTCADLDNWASSYGVNYTYLFSDSNIIMNEFGSPGMPKVIVVGGPQHTIFYDGINNIDSAAIHAAIDSALLYTGISESEKSFTSMNVFPNPANDWITLKFNANKSVVAKIELYNLEGKLIETISELQVTRGSNEKKINLSEYSSGNYLLKLIAGGIPYYQNIVKE